MSVALDLIESAFLPGRWETDGPESHAKRAQELVPLLVAVARAARCQNDDPAGWQDRADCLYRSQIPGDHPCAVCLALAALEQYANEHLP